MCNIALGWTHGVAQTAVLVAPGEVEKPRQTQELQHGLCQRLSDVMQAAKAALVHGRDRLATSFCMWRQPQQDWQLLLLKERSPL